MQIGEAAITQVNLSNDTTLNAVLGLVPDNEVTTGRVSDLIARDIMVYLL